MQVSQIQKEELVWKPSFSSQFWSGIASDIDIYRRK